MDTRQQDETSIERTDTVEQDRIDEIMADDASQPDEKSNPNCNVSRSGSEIDDESSVEAIDEPIIEVNEENHPQQPHMIPSETPEETTTSVSYTHLTLPTTSRV